MSLSGKNPTIVNIIRTVYATVMYVNYISIKLETKFCLKRRKKLKTFSSLFPTEIISVNYYTFVFSLNQTQNE